MFRKMSSAVTALLFVASVAQAQYTANFNTGIVNGSTNAHYGGVYVGGYNGTLTGGTLPSGIAAAAALNRFWCLDFQGRFGDGSVVIRSFAQLIALHSNLTVPLTNVAKALVYSETVSNTEDAAIHEFIWNQFGVTPTWAGVTLDQSIFSSPVNLNEFFLAEFDGVSDGQFPIGGRQELAFRSVQGTTVPEPSTYILMASGLVVLGVLSRRRSITLFKV